MALAMTGQPSCASVGGTMTKQVVMVGDVRVKYLKIGYGPKLVLVDAGGSQSSWHHWARNLTALSSSYQLIIPDLPGLGESDPPSVAIDTEDDFFRYYPRFIHAFLRAVAPEGAVLVGAASGGGICLTAAARYPESV